MLDGKNQSVDKGHTKWLGGRVVARGLPVAHPCFITTMPICNFAGTIHYSLGLKNNWNLVYETRDFRRFVG